ncbi:MAG: D-alanyl-D-alanine carboxypeptidase/D-alanyl-D-alanine-endopeptidase [Candidatus Nitrohelix vancouverensis]|uniref:D-alanyl-D-alanine carboxypeptidase/D-alanyl-D-alanine-endopeptidase n=1 Tax=Candidatus Nitrohelix vancouverensis TaxID=2705534 RepID=A0A7T0BZT6_9BACT|nr:MAG: D-alanyl-D-alanine carboxypeptidase/D-alanyl-D-alanine-endopeptidase [Candidatus Nitrohelix vancouverensis]
MRNTLHRFISIPVLSLLFFFGVHSPAVSQTSASPEAKFQNALDRILSNRCLSQKNFSVKFVSLANEEVLYSVRSDALLIPASNMKLITSAVALKTLGPDYRFMTGLYSSARIQDEVLEGDLYVKGYGDPKLVTEQLWLMAQQVRNLPLKKITGDILVDDSFFDDIRRVESWKKRAGSEAYNAPLGALSLNFNTVGVHVAPSPKVNAAPIVVIEPSVDYIHLDNRATTLPPGKRGRLIVNRLPGDRFDRITVTGQISQDQARSLHYVNITQPSYYMGSTFKDFLIRAGVEVDGDVRRDAMPNHVPLLTEFYSEPLALSLRGVNKFSNNFMAEQLVKTIGGLKEGPPGTTSKGLNVIEGYLRSLGYGQEQFKVHDGSGLTRRNRLSADLLVSVLRDMFQDWSVFPEFFGSLAVMGVDGSVEDRLKRVPESQKVRVKTGTLNFTSSLSGYLQSADGERFAFSILMNDLKCSNGRVKRIQNAMIKEALKFHRAPRQEATAPAVDSSTDEQP